MAHRSGEFDEKAEKSNRLKAAKVHLYRLLLNIKNEEETDCEIDLLFALASDKQIQEVLSEVLNKQKKIEEIRYVND